ncbi:MAG: ADP-forming succinate--CoA ligase subunit beta [Thiotrichales bacterium]|nr:ADP-forming succinate--CoA ligase subunit beta [Thiotrichales bacterium]
MDIHEYQAKQLLRPYGLASPPGECAFTAEEAEAAARRIGGSRWAVKAQIRAGDRSRAGGVKMVTSAADVREVAWEMLDARLVTPQTGDEGEYVRRVYVEAVCRAASEHYLALGLDRVASRITLVGSDAGGTSLESVAGEHPERISQVAIDPIDGLNPVDARRLAADIGLGGAHSAGAERLMIGLYDAFVSYDASLIEINPLALTADGELLALDAKMSIDDNAMFRHRDIEDLRERDEEGRFERVRHGFNYIALDGDIGCVVNGAGLAMATMDILRLQGGAPANFLDLPPAAGRDRMTAACRLVLENPRVKVLLVNIVGGGMTRCDVVAEAFASACRAAGRSVPIVARFEGVNRELARKVLRDTGVEAEPAESLGDAAMRAVRAASGGAR